MTTAPILLQLLMSGIVTGCIYALVALSVVIIFKATDTFNFAGGELVTIGAYLAMLPITWLGLPYWVAFCFVVVVMFALGFVFERAVLTNVVRFSRPGQSQLVSVVIATFGLSYLIKGGLRAIPYTEQVRSLPPLVSGPPVFLGPVVLQRQDLAIVAITVIVMLSFWLFFGHSMVGRALRATSQKPKAAMLIGIPVANMRSLVWGISGVVAGTAGILLAPKLLVTPEMGGVVMLGLAAAVVGGFTNIAGAVVGGILVGVLQNITAFYLGSRTLSVTPFLIIMVVLALFPQGLFGGAARTNKV